MASSGTTSPGPVPLGLGFGAWCRLKPCPTRFGFWVGAQVFGVFGFRFRADWCSSGLGRAEICWVSTVGFARSWPLSVVRPLAQHVWTHNCAYFLACYCLLLRLLGVEGGG